MPDVMIGIIGSESAGKHVEMFAGMLGRMAKTKDCEVAISDLQEWIGTLDGIPYAVVIAALSIALVYHLQGFTDDMDENERGIATAGTLIFVSTMTKAMLGVDDEPSKEAN
jgi:hypothetical protein